MVSRPALLLHPDLPPPLSASRLLLYLEWILLGISLLTLIVAPPFDTSPTPSVLSVFCILAFGLLGLKLPTGRLSHKVLYTALEVSVMALPTLLDNSPRFMPLLGLVVVIRSCQMFRQSSRLIVAALVYALILWMLFSRFQGPLSQAKALWQDASGNSLLILRLNAALSFGLALSFVLLLVNALLAERQSRAELFAAHQQLRQYALRIEDQATLQERNRIAREIHDALGHTLTAQSIQLENASLFLSSNLDQASGFLSEAKQLGSQALKEVRQSVATLRANPLQGQSFETAIASLIKDFHSITGIHPDCFINVAHPLSSETKTTVYRILQEAMTNIYKHSQATRVILYLQETKKNLYLRVEDNGKGFNPRQNTTGFGLQSMQERTVALGGQFDLISHTGAGCLIMIQVPLLRTVK
jgi:signal transduction histidine kinase